MPRSLAATCGVLAATLTATTAIADSCWDHNGSVMRLTDADSARTFLYERPRQSLRGTGVEPGVWLFSGTKKGDWYEGTARIFSSACPNAPLEYWVEGPVLQNPLRIRVTGRREVYDRCQPTGRWTEDVLVFTYQSAC